MDNNFKATHIIVATRYESAKHYGLEVGTEVFLDNEHEWLNSAGYRSPVCVTTVVPIKPAATLFTEAQLRELEGLYGMVRVSAHKH